jgi:hypothetical protein
VLLFTRKSVSGINSIEDLSDVGPDSFLSNHVFSKNFIWEEKFLTRYDILLVYSFFVL